MLYVFVAPIFLKQKLLPGKTTRTQGCWKQPRSVFCKFWSVQVWSEVKVNHQKHRCWNVLGILVMTSPQEKYFRTPKEFGWVRKIPKWVSKKAGILSVVLGSSSYVAHHPTNLMVSILLNTALSQSQMVRNHLFGIFPERMSIKMVQVSRQRNDVMMSCGDGLGSGKSSFKRVSWSRLVYLVEFVLTEILGGSMVQKSESARDGCLNPPRNTAFRGVVWPLLLPSGTLLGEHSVCLLKKGAISSYGCRLPEVRSGYALHVRTSIESCFWTWYDGKQWPKFIAFNGT